MIDGEGCIDTNSVNKSKSRRTSSIPTIGIRLTATNSNFKLMEKMQELWAGGITHKAQRTPRLKRLYQWNIKGERASCILNLIEPYLIGKRKQAFLARMLASTQMTNGKGPYHRLPLKVRSLRHTIASLIRRLNTRGIIEVKSR